MMNNPKVAGALIDFIGFLTTQDSKITIGAQHEVYDLHSAFDEWCNTRNLDISKADVQNWGRSNEVLLRQRHYILQEAWEKMIEAENEYNLLLKLLKDSHD